MDRDQRQRARTAAEQVAEWVDRAQTVAARRNKAEQAGAAAVTHLRSRVVDVRVNGARTDWRVMPLRANDDRALGAIARQSHLPPIPASDLKMLNELTVAASAALHEAKSSLGLRRIFSSSKKRASGASAADFLTAFVLRALATGLPSLLDKLSAEVEDTRPEAQAGDALADWVGLCPHLSDLGTDPEVLPATMVGGLAQSIKTIESALLREQGARDDVKAAGESVRQREVRKLLAGMPVERLKDATRGLIRIGALVEAGVETVQDVLDHGRLLEHYPGIGETTAIRARGAAQTLWQTTYEEMPVRIDIKNRTDEATDLLRHLTAWDALRKVKGATDGLALKEALAPLAAGIDKEATHILVLAVDRATDQLHAAIESVHGLAARVAATSATSAMDDPWDDFLARPADYYALLSELGFTPEDEEKSHGELPDDVIEAVRRLELDTRHLSASLRGYQSFAARFALAQRKVIIGDEMGLGKTVEAIAVLAHLWAKGARHSLVICPAAVVTNWVREVQSKSSLRVHRVHGPGRELALRNWGRNGGVAVTTFDTLAWVGANADDHGDIACVVVDEAHYIKNPDAKRSKRVSRLVGAFDHAILLTGTPLENRVDEFRNLVGYIRPDLVVDANELAPRRFRRQVAPAYLRRNQEDVLTELPELVEVEEWVSMSADDEKAYRNAVFAGNFMAMRQAAMASGDRSEKMQRLIEIVGEAEDNGRRVIVFSHFRNVLDQVTKTLPGKVFGPLNGSVPAAARQTMVNQFSASGHGAVLVSQIVAGGEGLNIQAASVVVICEPQLKPTTEWQAIARARRMGQLETVQVHRLLSDEGVDRRVTDILARKKELFADFARVSETAESAPEAFDVSEAELARVVAAERERLLSRTHAEPEHDESAI